MPGVLPTGIGNDQQALQATAFIRQQPWYLDWLARNRITSGADQQVKLTKPQRQELRAMALARGVGLNHTYDEIDENGQIAEGHHKLKKVAIGAAIGGLALTGFGAAGIGPLAGALGGASAAAGGAGAAATAAGTAAPLAATTIGTGFIPAIAGGAGLAAGGAGAAAAAAAGGGAMSYLAGPVGSQLVRGGFDLFGSLFSGKMAANGQTEAARIASESAKYAADLQAKANTEATAFSRAQAENTWQNSEAARHGNYDQWAAGQHRLQSVGDYLGLGPREIPSYVPGIDPRFLEGSPAVPAGPGATPGAPAAASSGDPVIDALTANYAALGTKPTGPGTGPTDIAYMAQKINETGGLTADNTKYWFGPQGRIAAELAKAAGGASSAPTVARALPGAPADYLTGTPFLAPPVTPGLRMPGAVASYL